MSSSNPAAVARPAAVRHRWLPRQHGSWAMLLLPLLLGVAASGPDAWQLVLGGAAVAGYVGSATVQAWSRARRAPAYRLPIAVWGGAFGVLGLVLVAAFPVLLLGLVVLVPTGVLVLAGARPGRHRDLANSLGQVAQALLLVPAAAIVSGSVDPRAVVVATLVAAGYLLGTVLVVRSMLRERGNRPFTAFSIAFHVVIAVLAALFLQPAYTLVAAWLLIRAVALPLLGERRSGGPRPLRPVDVGIVEILSSLAVVAVSFAVPS